MVAGLLLKVKSSGRSLLFRNSLCTTIALGYKSVAAPSYLLNCSPDLTTGMKRTRNRSLCKATTSSIHTVQRLREKRKTTSRLQHTHRTPAIEVALVGLEEVSKAHAPEDGSCLISCTSDESGLGPVVGFVEDRITVGVRLQQLDRPSETRA